MQLNYFDERDDISLVVDEGTKIIYTRRLNKGFRSKFPESYPDRHRPDEGQKVQWSKRCDNSNKNKDNSLDLNNVNDDNSSAQKGRQKRVSM